MKLPETLRARLTFWYVLALTLTLSAFALLLYAWLGGTLYSHHDHELLESGNQIAQRLRNVALDENSIEHALAEVDGVPPLLMVRDHAGELIYRSPVLRVAEPTIGRHEALVHAVAHAPLDPEFFTVTLERSGLVRFICTPIGGTPAAYMQIGNELGDVPATLHAVAIASMVLVPLVVVLTSFGGWMLAGRALAPIERISSTLRAIEATGLSRRVEVHPPDRELSGLVGTINSLLARLDRAFKDLRDFTADASHQLQTPLTVMKSTIELARRAAAPGAAEATLDDLEEEVNDMSTVVADLQALSLADADQQRSMRTRVDLSGTCVDAVEILEALGEQKSVHIDADITPDVTVWGDAGKLKQVILNLGDNAIKYTAPDGRVRIQLYADDSLAVLEVSDTGVGISPDQLPHVFDRFYRAPAATGSHGTGLGLAIAKRIIEVHAGEIGVTSALGKGTRFTVRLPAADGSIRQPARPVGSA